MKNVTLFLTLIFVLFGLAGNILAYEGGTKLVATMVSPTIGEAKWGPTSVSSYGINATKFVVSFFRRMPEPSLSPERIREERRGRSSGTKAVVLFQKNV